MSDWLDLELSHHLAPVKAPEDLWDRVCAPRRSRPHVALPIAAVVTLVLAGALYFIARGQPIPAPYRANYGTETCLRCHS